jgi:hypothetical protein
MVEVFKEKSLIYKGFFFVKLPMTLRRVWETLRPGIDFIEPCYPIGTTLVVG